MCQNEKTKKLFANESVRDYGALGTERLLFAFAFALVVEK